MFNEKKVMVLLVLFIHSLQKVSNMQASVKGSTQK